MALTQCPSVSNNHYGFYLTIYFPVEMQKYKGKSTSTTIEGSKQKRGSLSLADASWLSLPGQRLLEGSDEVLSAAFWGFECVHSSRVVHVRHVMGMQERDGEGGNVCCYKGIRSFHLLLPFEKHRSVWFEVYVHFYIVHCSSYCHVHINPKDEFNNIWLIWNIFQYKSAQRVSTFKRGIRSHVVSREHACLLRNQRWARF